MPDEDVRWIQRYNSFHQALLQLKKFVDEESLNELEEQGLIKSFEYTFELAWNTLKDYMESQGITGLIGSRDTLRMAFRRELIADGEIWMDMIKSRVQTAHTYNQDLAREISAQILTGYYPNFVILQATLAHLAGREE